MSALGTPSRNDRETITRPVLGKAARRTGRGRCCSDACRHTAPWRRTNSLADPDPAPAGRSRKTQTVYN